MSNLYYLQYLVSVEVDESVFVTVNKQAAIIAHNACAAVEALEHTVQNIIKITIETVELTQCNSVMILANG